MTTVTVVEPVQSASPQRFERIYREQATFVFRTAYGVTGNREDAEDILQAVFVALMTREFPEDFEKNPRGYLYRAATGRTRISRRMGQPSAN